MTNDHAVTGVALSSERWRIVSPHLAHGLELTVEARRNWLASVRQEDPALAADLEALLSERDALSREGFLAVPLLGPPPASLAGQVLGAYTLRSLIGQGGMGTVWLAERSDGRFEGVAAVKLLNASLVGRDGEARFKHEGILLARLRHPHIAHLIDAGVSPAGQPYLVLEHIDGGPIDRHCDERNLAIEARIRLFLDVLSAVALAHSNLIVHRDLKPSNVLVATNGQVKLLDFGIAKLLDFKPGAGDAGWTREGQSALTPAYAAPEQLTGGDITTATDVYALGVLLYLLLTGRHPAHGKTASAAELVKAIVETEPVRPSDAVTPSHRTALRGDLDNILAKALHKAPAGRYSSAELFADDLRRFLAHEPVSARARSFPYRASKFIKRHRGGVTSTVLVAASLVIGIATTTWQLIQTGREREMAIASAGRAEASKEFLTRVLSEFQIRGEPLTTKALLQRGSDMLDAQYAEQPRFVAEMLLVLAKEHADVLDVKAARALREKARGLAERAGDDLLLARAECALARNDQQGGRYDTTPARLATAKEALSRAPVADVEIQVECLRPEAALLVHKGDRPQALKLRQDTRAMLEQAGKTRTTVYNAALSDIGTQLMDEGRVAEALAVFELSVQVHRSSGRGGTRAEMIAQRNVVSAYFRLGEVRKSYEVAGQLRDLRLRLQSSEDLSPMVLLGDAARANRLRRADPALEALPATVTRTEAAGDMTAFRFASAELAWMRFLKGASRAEVEAPLRHMETVHRGPLPFQMRVRCLWIRAELDLAEGLLEDANRRAEALREELASSDAAGARMPQPIYWAQSILARIALANADPFRAEQHAQKALNIVAPIARNPDSSADVGEGLLLLARTKLALQDQSPVHALLDRALRCLVNGLGSDHPSTQEARALRATLQR